ncbi:MAG: enoyl-CoA hydratase/isomerase family protein [Gammaproteobacteria bacterium]|nr:enoyl-CoA hydratase/isomerase family protein [Gammaproteobacteria bacterium]
MNYQTVEYEVRAGVASVCLNRPECLNAMNRQLVDDVANAFRQANRDPQAGVILFCGAGRAFCAGDDRRAHQHFADEASAREFVDAIQQATREILFGEKLVVGAVQGWAVGGGFEWALNCDLSVWGRGARAFFPEVSLNLLVTGGVTSLLPAIVGLGKAREMLLLGERYDAQQLHDIGIAWRVVDDDRLMDEARALAARLADLPRSSTRAMKRVLNQVGAQSIETALQLETEATVAGFLDPETTRLLQDF